MAENYYEEITKSVESLASDLGLPKDFFNNLYKKDEDWSFVIKLHALFEAAIAHLLEHELGRSGVSEFIGSLNIRGRTGKLALARALGCIDAEQAGFIERLSEIRNRCVHDVRSVNFSLKGYVAGLDPAQRRKLDQALKGFVADEMEFREGVKLPRIELLEQQPKLTLWMAAMVLLALIYQSKELARLVAENKRLLLGQSTAASSLAGALGSGKEQK